jgi:hypothetical protein
MKCQTLLRMIEYVFQPDPMLILLLLLLLLPLYIAPCPIAWR